MALEPVYTAKAMAALLEFNGRGAFGEGPVLYWHTYGRPAGDPAIPGVVDEAATGDPAAPGVGDEQVNTDPAIPGVVDEEMGGT